MYELGLAHTFQRRFDSDALAEALSESHIYVISRRPKVRIKERSVWFHPERIKFEVVSKVGSKGEWITYPLEIAGKDLRKACDFRTYQDGSYFSYRVGAALLHGDSWALGSLCSRAGNELSHQDVMYVGMAYGKAASSNAWARTRRHEKLQRIYEDHVGDDWDIFVSAFEIVRCDRVNVDHIDDAEGGNPIGIIDKKNVFWDRPNRRPSKVAVKLVEHSLIAYFDPPYNGVLNEWRAGEPTAEMRIMRDAGFRLIRVHLTGQGSLVRLFSRRVKLATRSHLIFHDTPPAPRRPVLRGIGAERINEWRASLLRLTDAEAIVADGEVADLALLSFGRRAPAVRKPPEVSLGEEVGEIKTVEEREAEFGLLSGIDARYDHPDFDHDEGRFSVGLDLDGSKVYWDVWDEDGNPRHAVIMGPTGSGKTNVLSVAVLGIAASGLFVSWLSDVTDRHNILRVWGILADWIAVNPHELLLMLGAALAIAEDRRVNGVFKGISRKTPGILLVVEDLHLVVDQMPHLVGKFERLSEIGPAAGVAIVVTVPDSNIARFGGSEKLRSNLGTGHRQVLGIFDGDDLFADFD
ncbi:hypothetical protein FBZ33_4643 [Micromonospora sp. A202]|nr:hypothetical protein FBZ33_4643 [Micromonospora sp. A202]